jgi:hypothetical protein
MMRIQSKLNNTVSFRCDLHPENVGSIKLNFTLEEAMKAQRGSRGKALLFL